MPKKIPHPESLYDQTFSTAADLWKFLKTYATEPTLYDQELPNGIGQMTGIRGHLGIPVSDNLLEDDLAANEITVEQFVVAFYKTLQPFAQMMSDLCIFFEQNGVKKTNQALKIKFDFEAVQDADLEFDLDSFRSATKKFSTVAGLVNFYQFNSNNLFNIFRILSHNDINLDTRNKAIASWRTGFFKQVSQPPADLPETGNTELDETLQELFAIAISFIDAVINLGGDFSATSLHIDGPVRDRYDRSIESGQSESGWDVELLVLGIRDNWPANLIAALFMATDVYSPVPGYHSLEALGTDLKNFLDSIRETRKQPINVAETLQDLLKLPIWKFRNELYSAWIITQVDQAITTYGRHYHVEDNKLILSFKPTLIATIETVDGDIEFWSEVRLPGDIIRVPERPNGNIQPDYTIFNGELKNENCIAAIEVKQYKTPSTRNFQNALNDYAAGLLNAHVFLVNYGAMSQTVVADFSERSDFMGMIRPGLSSRQDFIAALRLRLPGPRPPFPDVLLPGATQQDINEIRRVYVDISGSLDNHYYREYVKDLMSVLMYRQKIDELIAVDNKIVKRWNQPDEGAVDELLALPFNDNTDFAALLPADSSFLVLTDEDGASRISATGRQGIRIAVFTKLNPVTYEKS